MTHNSLKIGATQGSIGRSMDKQNVIDTYNRTVFSLKKKGNFDLYSSIWLNLEDIMLREIN